MPTPIGENRFLRYGSFRYYPPGRTSVLEMHRSARGDDWPLWAIRNAIMEKSWPTGLYIRPAPEDKEIATLAGINTDAIWDLCEIGADGLLIAKKENLYTLAVLKVNPSSGQVHEIFRYERPLEQGPIRGAQFHAGGRLFCVHADKIESFFIDADFRFVPMVALPPLDVLILPGGGSLQVPISVRIAYRLRTSGYIVSAGPPRYAIGSSSYYVFPVGLARIPDAILNEYVSELVVLLSRPEGVYDIAREDFKENLMFHRTYYAVSAISLGETQAKIAVPEWVDLLKNEPYTEEFVPWVSGFSVGAHYGGRYVYGAPQITYFAPDMTISFSDNPTHRGHIYVGVALKTEEGEIWAWRFYEHAALPARIPSVWSYPSRSATRVAIVWEDPLSGDFDLLWEKRLRIGKIEASYYVLDESGGSGGGAPTLLDEPKGTPLPGDIPAPYMVGDRHVLRRHYIYISTTDDRLAIPYSASISPGGPQEHIQGMTTITGIDTSSPAVQDRPGGSSELAAPAPDGLLILWTNRSLYQAQLDYVAKPDGSGMWEFLRIDRLRDFAPDNPIKEILVLSKKEIIGLSSSGRPVVIAGPASMVHFISGLNLSHIRHIALWEDTIEGRYGLVLYRENNGIVYIIDLLSSALYELDIPSSPIACRGITYVTADGKIRQVMRDQGRVRHNMKMASAPIFFSPIANTIDNIWRIALRTEGSMPDVPGRLLVHIEDKNTLDIPLSWQEGHWGSSQNMPPQCMGRYFRFDIEIQRPPGDMRIWGLDVEYDVRKVFGLR